SPAAARLAPQVLLPRIGVSNRPRGNNSGSSAVSCADPGFLGRSSVMRERKLGGVVALVATLVLPLTAAADIYQYVDADGTVHFTNSKPASGAKVYLKTQTPAGTPRPG